MTAETPSKGNTIPKLVTLQKGLKLAESWVDNMSGTAADESTEAEFDGRQPRLGLGAKAVQQSRVGGSADPVERRLLAKIDSQKRRAARSIEESNPTEREAGGNEDSDDSDVDAESRSAAFSKKRRTNVPPPLHPKKKK